MEMRAIEDIAIGQDLTPPLRPLAFVLRDFALNSYCTACFSTLPAQPFPPFSLAFTQNPCHVPQNTPTPLYCSPDCASFDSPLHLSSGESHLLSILPKPQPSLWNDSSDLRLTLRLVSIFQKPPKKYSISPRSQGLRGSDQEKVLFGGYKENPFTEKKNIEDPDDYLENNEEPWERMKRSCPNDVVFERMAGLMTNREKLVFPQNRNNPDEENCGNCENLEEENKILERIREGAKMVAKSRRICLNGDVNMDRQDEFVLEEMVLCLVLTNSVEVQVHDKSGCTIGVAVYDTAFSWINHSCSPNACYRFSVGPEADNEHSTLRITPAAKNGYFNDLMVESVLNYSCIEKNGYGPTLIVRSVKNVREGEEVTIAYTDLLQPKEMRQAELWVKYRFRCSCKRCGVTPTSYVDNVLQAVSAISPDTSPESSHNETDILMQSFDNAITDYLSLDDPISCCKKLENLLAHGHLIESKSPQKLKLHILHYLSLNAYTTLASAYKVRADDLLALLNHDVERRNRDAFNMYKTSAAYSLLLAGGAHHLFTSESSFIATVANFWTNAGESILNFARSSLWGSFCLRSSFVSAKKCSNCHLADILEPKYVIPDRNLEFVEIKIRVYNCIADITPKVWSALACESDFLKVIRNPVDFSWLEYSESRVILEDSRSDSEECDEHVRMNLILLGVHCSMYGVLLSSISYGLSAYMKYSRALAFIKYPA
ncbi:hypothetical protein OROHE_023571 [Orobanche hederae]